MPARKGPRTVALSSLPRIRAEAAVVGKKEGQGPLGRRFDHISRDSYFGQKSWEKAESSMLQHCFDLAISKASMSPAAIQYILAGDLLNQCTGSAFALRHSGLPFFGLYGACSTMGESLSLAAMLIDGGFAENVCAMTSSHFCSAERQFRLPLEYGGQRSPTAQWTVTGAGAVILSSHGNGPAVSHVTTGSIVDAGITDGSNMGAAMAPAAYDTLSAFFRESGMAPTDFDLIATGDLGSLGHDIVRDLFRRDGVELPGCYTDCGLLLFDRENQDMHAGASGCGCSAAVLNGYLLQGLQSGLFRRILFAPTGALLSPVSTQQGESIPAICHALVLSREKEVS